MKRTSLVAVICTALLCSARAGVIGVDPTNGGTGLVSGSGGLTLGWEFEVSATAGIVVDGLGFWDHGANGFLLAQTFHVGLWDASTGTLLRDSVVTSSSTLLPSAHADGDWRVNPIPPVLLPPARYRVGALMPVSGANQTVASGATVQTEPGITLIRYLRQLGSSTLAMPNAPPPTSGSAYFGPTFTFTSEFPELTNFCVAFSELASETVYGVNNAFTSGGINCGVERFQWTSGQWTSNGFARVETNGFANVGSEPPHLWLGNVNLRPDFGIATDISLRYGAFGGNQNLRINGALTNFGAMAALHGKTLGGVRLALLPSSNARGELRLSGIITDFAIGGQEFAIDDICITPYTGPKFREILLGPSGQVMLTFSYPGTDPSRLVLQYADSLDGHSGWRIDSAATIISTSSNWFQAATTTLSGMDRLFYRIESSPP